jgi:prepilin-type N-terminal cleavage/methylation domain-containing protein
MTFRKGRGFSLIEFMVAMLVAVIFAIFMMSLLNNITRRSSLIKETIDVSKTSRISLFAMARDIANAGYMLNCVGRSCGSVLQTPAAQATTTGYATSTCVYSGTTGTGCKAIEYSTSTSLDTLKINYGALSTTDVIQVVYSLDKANLILKRKQVKANDTVAATDDEFANNVVQMAFKFGTETGTVASPNFNYNNTPPTTLSQLRSIKIALLTRSEFPDKKYTSPATIAWLGGTYTVPTSPDQSHYRFNVAQQEVYLHNLAIIDP